MVDNEIRLGNEDGCCAHLPLFITILVVSARARDSVLEQTP